jgi:hypothetical protein
MRRLLPLVVAAVTVAVLAPPALATPGGTIWTATYDGPASQADTPRGIVIDPDHLRVYVAGTTGSEADADIVTIAYDLSTGAKLWARRYDGPAHGADLGVAVAYNPAVHSVVVTGMSESVAGTGRIDAVTISYAFDGAHQWTHRVSSLQTDAPVALVVEGGSTYVLINGTHGRLVAYDGAGTRVWIRKVTSDDVVALTDLDDIGGYLLVVGTVAHLGGTAMFTAGFHSDGTPVWIKRFAGPSHDGYATDAAVGEQGTILYVTGLYTNVTRKITTVAYEPHDGFRFWRRSIAPQTTIDHDTLPRVAVSHNGADIVVAATSYSGTVPTYLTRQYHGDGSVAWTARENAPNDTGTVSDVAIGPDGNVYVTGQGTNSGGALRPLTVAYPSTGGAPLFEAPIAPVNVDDGAFCLIPGPYGARVFVGSRVAGDLRVDAYAAS